MPIVPMYEPTHTGGPADTGLNVQPSRTPGGPSLVRGGGEITHAPDAGRYHTEKATLANFYQGMNKFMADRRAIELDNVVVAAREATLLGLDNVKRGLAQEGVGTGPGQSSQYLSEYERRSQGMLDDVEKMVRQNAGRWGADEAVREVRRGVGMHVLQDRLGAATHSDMLLKSDTERTSLGLRQQAELQAADLGLAESPANPADQKWALAGLQTYNDHVDHMVQTGMITSAQGEREKKSAEQDAIYARGQAMARDVPGSFLQRNLDWKNDPLLSKLDPTKRVALETAAENRELHLRNLRYSEHEQERKLSREAQEDFAKIVTAQMDLATVTTRNLSGFEQIISDNARQLGPEGVGIATAHLFAARQRLSQPLDNIPKDISDRRAAEWIANIYQKRGEVSLTDIYRDPQLRSEEVKSLVTLTQTQRQAEAKEWHGDEFKRLETELSYVKPPSYATVLGYDKPAVFVNAARNELSAWIQGSPTATRSQLSAATTEILQRYVPQVEAFADHPEVLLDALPKDPRTGTPYRTPDEVLRATNLSRAQKDAALGTLQWVESRKKSKPKEQLPPGTDESGPATRKK